MEPSVLPLLLKDERHPVIKRKKKKKRHYVLFKKKHIKKKKKPCQDFISLALSSVDIPGLMFLDSVVSSWDSWIPVPLLQCVLSWLEFSEFTALRLS